MGHHPTCLDFQFLRGVGLDTTVLAVIVISAKILNYVEFSSFIII